MSSRIRRSDGRGADRRADYRGTFAVQWLKHAFAIESPTDAEPTPAEAALVERVCREVVRRRLTTPALLLLEMSRPLNYVGSQTLRFFEPLLGAFVGTDVPATFATFLERRGSIEVLCRRIEELERDATQRESAAHEESE